MCAVRDCKALPQSISSIKIPDGLKVTMYSGLYFTGSAISYEGPADIQCLSWESWSNLAKSVKIESIEDRPRSDTEWTMKVFKADGDLVNMPAIHALDVVGEPVAVPWINLHGLDEFRKYQPITPSKNFLAVFWGLPEVRQPGQYEICVTSTDGSQVFVQDELLINNDGRHAQTTKCATRSFGLGKVKMEVRYFHYEDAPSVLLMWKGPGTDENMMVVRCEDKMALDQIPPDTVKSDWAARVFTTSRSYVSIPDLDMCTLAGSATGIPRASFDSVFALRKYIKETPDVNFLWVLYGSVRIRQPGMYTFCSCSADGSRIILDNLALVDTNTGIHERDCNCGTRTLAAGEYPIQVEGYDGSAQTGANEMVKARLILRNPFTRPVFYLTLPLDLSANLCRPTSLGILFLPSCNDCGIRHVTSLAL
jgi:hypothetical protein